MKSLYSPLHAVKVRPMPGASSLRPRRLAVVKSLLQPAVVAVAGLCALLAVMSSPAQAVGRLADITIVDRDTGSTLPVHYARGEYWVAGRPGARYAIAIHNRSGQRLLAVPSVDGVNAITGDTASWEQSGYVFSPHERYRVTGWRKSHSEIAAFEFSSADTSYAARTGRVANVGVIGVALFRERQPLPSSPLSPPLASVDAPSQGRQMPLPSKRSADTEASRKSQSSALPEPGLDSAAPAPPRAGSRAAPSAAADAMERTAPSGNAAESMPAPASQPAPRLGTAHGQRESSVVGHTTFERLQNQPNEVISIRYDSRANLIASGVIREATEPRWPRAFPQSDDLRYVPDPPRY